MASYAETIVGSGEQIVHVGRLSLWTILSSLLGGTSLIVVAIGLLVVPVGRPVSLMWWRIAAALGAIIIVVASSAAARRARVTNRRVIAKFGLVAGAPWK